LLKKRRKSLVTAKDGNPAFKTASENTLSIDGSKEEDYEPPPETLNDQSLARR
jgi:hypothetical protein